MKTTLANPDMMRETHKFFLVDAEGVTLGRLATRVATLLSGKHKPIYTPFLDTGDHVVIVNADKVAMSGNKWQDKPVRRHTRYPGGLKTQTAGKVLEKHPERIIMHAVRGMLPKSRLGRKMLKKLFVYKGAGHPHAAQKPETITI